MIRINIGLHRNTGGIIPATLALNEIRRAGGIVTKWSVIESDSEPTLSAELRGAMPAEALDRLCERLDQDCVAVIDSLGGYLHGPKALDWGPFNPAYFFTVEGERLEPLAA